MQPFESYSTESITESNFPVTNIPLQKEQLPRTSSLEIGGYNEHVVLTESTKEQSITQSKNSQGHSKISVNTTTHTPNTTAVILEEISHMETPVTNLSTALMKSNQQASLVRFTFRMKISIQKHSFHRHNNKIFVP